MGSDKSEILMFNEMDKHFNRYNFRFDKNKDGQFDDEFSLLLATGFVSAWRDLDPTVRYLLSEVKKVLSHEEYEKLEKKIHTGEPLTKMQEKIHEYEGIIHSIIDVALAEAEGEEALPILDLKFGFISYGSNIERVNELLTPKFNKYIVKQSKEFGNFKGVEDQEALDKLTQEMIDTSTLLERMEIARVITRDSKIVDLSKDKTYESKVQEVEFIKEAIEIVENVGGVIKAREIIKSHGINAFSMFEEDRIEGTVNGNDGQEYSIKEVYTAMYFLYSNKAFISFKDSKALEKAINTVERKLSELGLNQSSSEICAVKAVITTREGRQQEFDLNMLKFMHKHFNEIQSISMGR